jgi:hypothetical protein
MPVDLILMPRACMCDVCDFHRQSGSVLYTTDGRWHELGPVEQKIQLERHKTHGVCPHFGPPFAPEDLTDKQLRRYNGLWPPSFSKS